MNTDSWTYDTVIFDELLEDVIVMDELRLTNLDNSDLNFLISRLGAVITDQLTQHHQLKETAKSLYAMADKDDPSEQSQRAFAFLNAVRGALRSNKEERKKLARIQSKLKATRSGNV